METDTEVKKQLAKIFSLAIKDQTFLGKLAANPQEVLQSSGLTLSGDQLNAHLHLTERGEIDGSLAVQLLNAVMVGLIDLAAGRIVSPPPPPPPPPPWWPSEEAYKTLLRKALTVILSESKKKAQSKARVSPKKKSKKGATRKGRRR